MRVQLKNFYRSTCIFFALPSLWHDRQLINQLSCAKKYWPRFLQLNNPTWTLTSLSVALKLWSRLSQIDVRCKQEQSTKHTEGLKWLHESCTVFGSIQFNQPDFDKTIIFVFCTIAHIAIASLTRSLLSVRLVGSTTASGCSIWHRLPLSTLPPPLLCIPVATHHGFWQYVDDVPEGGISSLSGLFLLNSYWVFFFKHNPINNF